ncbi:MAG: hypothetical protein ACK4FA_00035 [Candidatus Paceibacteria bacterium]
MQKILLNEKVCVPNEQYLPCLIDYGEGSGGSQFSITFVVKLFNSGSKVLFFTAYQMAKENLYSIVGDGNPNVAFITDVSELDGNLDKQCIIVESGNEQLFIECIAKHPELLNRVILIKNIENFSQQIFDMTINLPKVIFSGDLNACVAKDVLMIKDYESIIVFPNYKTQFDFEIPELEKYTGFIHQKNGTQGVIKLSLD